MDIQLGQAIVVLIFAFIMSVAYEMWTYLMATTPETYDVRSFIATFIYSLFLGAFVFYQWLQGVITIDQITWVYVGGLALGFQAMLTIVNHAVDWIWFKIFNVPMIKF